MASHGLPEICCQKIIYAEVGKLGEWSTTTHEACWKAALSMTKASKRMTSQQTTKIRDEDCMQVDRTKLEKLTKKECEHLQKCRGCFFCQKDGHMMRECPEKRKTNQGPAPEGKPKARTMNIQEKREDSPLSYKSLVANIHAMICTMMCEKKRKTSREID
jgi:hypothetical protein